MEGILDWLERVERAAADLYRAAALRFSEDERFSLFLGKLAEEELWHLQMVRSMASLEDLTSENTAVRIDEATCGNISELLATALGELRSGEMTREAMLETVAAVEFSEWNEIFLYILQIVKGRGEHYDAAVLELERHKEEILEFLSSEPAGVRLLETLRGLPGVAGKRILVVEAHNALAMLLRSALSPIGEVLIAENGPDGLALVEEGGFDVILSDINMPAMESLEFYDRVVRMAPEMKNRFVFFSRAERESAYGSPTERDATLLVKPAMLSHIRRTVAGIANGSRQFH